MITPTMGSEEDKQIPAKPKSQKQKETNPVENGQNLDTIVFSPRFKSMAAMAGWDEEALLVATLIVEDTPDRETKYRKRSDLHFKTPPTNSRRKRRPHRTTPEAIPVAVLDLDQGESPRKDSEKKKKTVRKGLNEEKKAGEKESDSVPSAIATTLTCIDKLREELSCAICLEICFEPSTTTCGHSFCRKCLRSASEKCGKKCPKCRQLISNGRSCTVNTVLWNTIQLLFPQEVAGRVESEAQSLSPETAFYHNLRNGNDNTRASGDSSRASRTRGREVVITGSRRVQISSNSPRGEENQSLADRRNQRTRSSQQGNNTRRRHIPSQDEDAALALRLQREEFLGTQHNLTTARANLRAMASKAINLRIRSRQT